MVNFKDETQNLTKSALFQKFVFIQNWLKKRPYQGNYKLNK
jgi:hypothetical protein